MEEYEKRVVEMVDEIGHKMNVLSVKTVALLARGPLRRVIRGIYIENKGLEEVMIIIINNNPLLDLINCLIYTT